MAIELPAFADPAKFRTSPPQFLCGEALEEDGGKESIGRSGVLFFCTLPDDYDNNTNATNGNKNRNRNHCTLTFHCRDRSCAVLEQHELVVTNDQFEETEIACTVDPFFFHEGYTLAGRTGFQVWSGTRLLIESLLFPNANDNNLLVSLQDEIIRSSFAAKAKMKILELGAGVGVVGTTLAYRGCQVLLTDLPTLVENSLLPNLKRNSTIKGEPSSFIHGEPPSWLCSASLNLEFKEEEDTQNVVFPIGNMGGWASISTIDWTQPLNKQVSSISSLEWIIASDCVWLVTMLESLFDTVDSLFQLNTNSKLLLSFQRRDGTDSTQFSSLSSIVKSVRERQWTLDCLAWRYVRQEGETDEMEVFFFEIKPQIKKVL